MAADNTLYVTACVSQHLKSYAEIYENVLIQLKSIMRTSSMMSYLITLKVQYI